MSIRRINTMDIKQISKIYIDSWKVTYRAILPDEYLDSLTYTYAEKKWKAYVDLPDNCIYAAMDESGTIIGFVACKLHREREECGLLDSLHVDKRWKGKGIGKQLIFSAANHFREQACTSMIIRALLGNNNAIELYQYLGATYLEDFTHNFDGVLADSMVLIWEDLNRLK